MEVSASIDKLSDKDQQNLMSLTMKETDEIYIDKKNSNIT